MTLYRNAEEYKKKLVFIIAISFLFFILLTQNVYSWKWLDNVLGNSTDNISDEYFTSVDQGVSNSMSSISEALASALLEPFTPNWDSFIQYTIMPNGQNAKTFLTGFAKAAGVFLSTLIFGFSLIKYFFQGKLSEMKDTPLKLLGKYILVLFLCYNTEAILTTFSNLMDTMYSLFTQTAYMESQAGIKQEMLNISSGMVEKGTKSVINILGIGVALIYTPIVGLIILIVELVLIWQVIKGIIALYMEVVSRYILTFVLIAFAPAFVSTEVSCDTSDVARSYFRTVFTSILLLIFNTLWFKMCLGISLCSEGSQMTLIGYIFLIKMLQLGQKLSEILRSMGLSVASSAQTMGMAGAGLFRGMMMMRMLGQANDAKNALGKSLMEKGALQGDAKGKAMYDAGSKIAGAAKEKSGNGFAPSMAGVSAYASKCGAVGAKMDDSLVSGTAAANIAGAAIGAKQGDKDALNAAKGLSNEKLKEGVQELCGDDIMVTSATMGTVAGEDGNFTGIKIDGYDENGEQISGILAGEDKVGSGVALSGGAAQDNGVMFRATSILKNGESCEVQNSLKAGQDVHNGIKSMKGAAAANAATYTQLGRSKTVSDSMNSRQMANAGHVLDKGGTVIGSVNGSQFTAAAATTGAWNGSNMSARDMSLDEIATKIESMGYQLDMKNGWQSVAGEEGAYTIAATDSVNGNDVKFTAYDKGLQTFASLNNQPGSFAYESKDVDGNRVAFDVNISGARGKKESTRGPQAKNVEFGGNPGGKPLSGR